MKNDPLGNNVSNTPDKKPETEEGKRLMEQSRNAIENNRDGFGGTTGSDIPATPDRFDSPKQGGSEPTHVPVRDSDRR